MLLFFPLLLGAQEYAVFKVEGRPMLVKTSNKTPISKGTLINSGKIAMGGEDELVVLNDKGEIFRLNSPGNYAFENIKKHKKDASDESFSSKYFAYVWREINGKEKTKTHTGNIYRDGLIDILTGPTDSVNVYGNKIVFSWNAEKGEPYYFFLKNEATNTISKMQVEGDSLVLFAGSRLLEKGSTYLWGVSTAEYPDFTRIKMNQLNYLDKKTYDEKKAEMEVFIQELKGIGLSTMEIKEQLCRYFKLCG